MTAIVFYSVSISFASPSLAVPIFLEYFPFDLFTLVGALSEGLELLDNLGAFFITPLLSPASILFLTVACLYSLISLSGFLISQFIKGLIVVLKKASFLS